MTHSKRNFVGALVLGLSIGICQGILGGTNHWTSGQAQGPSQVLIHITFHPTVAGVVMATHNGDPILFQSADGGAAWRKPMPQPPSAWPMTTIAFDPVNVGTVYAGSETGLYKSTDLGLTWTALTGLNMRVRLVVVDPVKPKILYASGDSMIRKSMDGGMYWQSASIPPYSCRTEVIIIDPVEDKTLYASDLRCGVKKSTDRGESWLSADRGLPPLPYAGIGLGMDPQNHKVLYSAVGGTIYRTVDAAQQWTVLGQGPVSDFRFMVDPRRSGVLYAITESVGYRSEDGAQTWAPFFSMSAEDRIYRDSFAIDPLLPGRLLACNPSGVIRSVDGGATWQSYLPGLAGGSMKSLAVSPDTAGLLLAGEDYALRRSLDGAVSWTTPETFGDRAGTPVVFAPSSPAICYTYGFPRFFRSTDAGATFNRVVNLPVLGFADLEVHPLDSNTLYGAKSDQLLKSSNGGESWANILATADCAPRRIAIDPTAPDVIYAGSDNTHSERPAGVWKSTDGGVTFSQSSAPFQQVRVFSLSVDPTLPSTLYAGLEYDQYLSPIVLYKSMDGAASWSRADAGLPALSVNAIAVDPRSPDTVYAGTNGGGIYRSMDAGASWSPMNNGLGWLTVLDLAVEPVAPGRVYASTDGGGVLVYEPDPDGPIIQGIAKMTDPYRLKVTGVNFTSGCVVEINGNWAPETAFKSSGEVLAKKGDALKAMLPRGVPVALTVYDPATSKRSPPFYYVR